MPSKKRKLNFDLEDAEQKSDPEQGLHSLRLELVNAIGACNLSELLDPEDLISFAAFKFGYSFIKNVISALSVIPDESGPWRPDLMKFLTSLLTENKRLNSEQECIVNAILQSSTRNNKLFGHGECYKQVFAQIVENTEPPATISPTEQCDMKFPLFAGCIAPPTKSCLVCHNDLKKHNNPSPVTYYLPSGPLPFVKVELRCRACELNYGITKYGNTKEGYKYYSHLGIVEASDVVYIDRFVMTMFKSLRYSN